MRTECKCGHIRYLWSNGDDDGCKRCPDECGGYCYEEEHARLMATETDLLNAAKNVTQTLRLPTLEAAITAYEEARR